ncbi:MAG TPA: aromatic-ring-hydroxylating dioxygenase subunit beta [Caulobacteraceae bacterium]|nr:aromatic-ring-hydroxylating dioxygenase subunit beta [Caulobacteraceae bacterium]
MSPAREEIETLYARHAELLDEGPISEWPSLFVEDGLYKAVTRENSDRGWPLALMLCESRAAIEDRVYAIEHLALKIPRRVRHLVSTIAFSAENGGYRVKANFAVFETLEGEPTVCFAAGRYHDALVRDGAGALRFREKVSIADSAIVRNSLVYPL